MEKLKDIRVIEPIDDISLYLFIIALVFVSLIIGALLYMLIKGIRKKREKRVKKEVLQRLKDIEFDNSKDASYKITKYARYLADDEKSLKMLEELLPHLEKYKFSKNPPKFDDKSIQYYNLFLKSVDG